MTLNGGADAHHPTHETAYDTRFRLTRAIGAGLVHQEEFSGILAKRGQPCWRKRHVDRSGHICARKHGSYGRAPAHAFSQGLERPRRTPAAERADATLR